MPLGILETTVDKWISTVKRDQISEPPKCEDPITSKSTAIVCNLIILLMCLGFITLMV
jgi:hypothetical protein